MASFRDYTLRQTWDVMGNCLHPEMPRIAVARCIDERLERADTTSGPPTGLGDEADGKGIQGGEHDAALRRPFYDFSSAEGARSLLLVIAGGRVRLWRQDRVARLDLAGIALESGGAGSIVRVRLPELGKIFRGVVRAPESVEMEAAAGLDLRDRPERVARVRRLAAEGGEAEDALPPRRRQARLRPR